MIKEDNLKLAQYVDGAKEDPTLAQHAGNVAEGVEQEVKNRRSANKVDVNKNWDFYQGDHAKYFKQRPTEPNKVFNERVDSALVSNYCSFIIDLGAKYLYGKPEGIRRTFSKSDTDNKTEKRLRHIESLNRTQSLMLKAKRWAGVFGEVTVRLIPIDERNNELNRGTSTDTSYPRAILLDTRYTYTLRNEWGKITAIVIKGTYRDYITGDDVTTTELVVSDSRWLWEDDKLVKAEKNIYSLQDEFVVLDNNDTLKDDIQAVIDLQVKLDESITDAAHFFEKHAWPQLLTKVDLSQVTKSPGYIWQIDSESDGKVLDDVDFLTWDGKMKESRQYTQDLESYIFKLTSTAKMATGDLESIGQLRSGAAIVAAHGPSIQKAEERQVVWRNNEIELFMAMARFDSRLYNQSVSTRFPELKVDIYYSDEFVPGEELIRAEIDAMAMNSHTTTIRDIQRRKFPALTEAEVDAKREEIFEDSEKLVDSKRAFVTEQVDGDSSAPANSGEKKSKEQKTTKE